MIDFWVALFATGSALVGGTCIGLMVGRIGLWREQAARKEAEKLNEELWLKITSLDPGDGAYPATADPLGDVGDLDDLDDDLHSKSAMILEFPVERSTTNDLLGTVELPPVAGDGGGEPVPRRRRVGAFVFQRWMPPKHHPPAGAQDSPGRGWGQ